MERMYKPREASDLLGVTVKTIQNWDNDGKIVCQRTPTNKRLIPESEIKRIQGERDIRRTVLYARVSTHEQKNDLKRQIQLLKNKYPNCDVYKDIASGMNFKRRNLLKMMEDVKEELVDKVVVLHKDRLVRFGFEFVETIFGWFGTTIEVIEDNYKSPEDELVKDMISIITSFSSRLYGMRSHKTKKILKKVKEVMNENDNLSS